MKNKIIYASTLLILSSTTSFAQMTGVGLESQIATGYGLYAVTMRADKDPGAISSFYMYDQVGTYPARWHEIDIEFTPGFTATAQIIDPNHPHFLATGDCYSPTSANNLPTTTQCSIKSFDSALTAGQKAGTDISFNSFNHRAIDGEPYAHTSDQVFIPSTHKNNIFSGFFTYYIYYTPKGIYWTNDLAEQKLTLNPPTTLPTPVFVKKDFNLVTSDPIWKNFPLESLAFQYDALPLAPQLANGKLATSGALMKISINLWDGSETDPNHIQSWGGNLNPPAGSSSSYKYIAYYPLTTPVDQVGNDPTKLNYGNAAIYSDFTTANGNFYADGKTTTFTNLWQISNGTYIWPLGQLDPRNITCGQGELQLKISNNYPTPRNNYTKLTECSWLNQN